MPSLDSIAASSGQSVIVYGPPKSGKTDLVVRQLAAHYKVIYVDLEKGRTTLYKLDDKLKANIDVIAILDNKDFPNAITGATKLASGGKYSYCAIHQKIGCVKCITSRDAEVMASQFSYEFGNLNPQEYVIVFDSFSQIASSAVAHVAKGMDLEKEKFTFDHWAALGVLLERFLDYCQCAPFNVVVITHEMGIEQEDGIEKLMPSGGTKNFARKIAKYFDHVVYCSLKNRKHCASSVTTDDNKVLAGSRTDVVVSHLDPHSMARLLGKKGLPPLVAVATVPKTSLLATRK
jgi:hypothetical protein